MAYAEIELDGNVHLIGTQGVGKSTLLRAILFFYNANKTKLGIPHEKKGYDEYYYPYQNSYIIYEVMKDGHPFSVLSYKVNGKVAFRFFDSGYQQKLFIDDHNRAFENWDQIRAAFGKSIYYTPIISSYDEFRKIIYGDNKTLKPEYRKYALIESRQYQNIPRTIQNVFLNSNLEAKFIKDTIINSLNEEEFTIDLENYSKNHLRGFESEINDISIWFKTNRKGEVTIRKQADSIIDHYRIYNFLKREKLTLFQNLLARIDFVDREKTQLQVQISEESQTRNRFSEELENLKDLHLKREQRIVSDINYFKRQIAEAQKKQEEYQRLDIEKLISKVAVKNSWQQQKISLEEEKTLLTLKFADIHTKYESLIKQIENEKQSHLNSKTAEINQLEQEFGKTKIALYESYQKIIEEIRSNSEEEETSVKNELDRLRDEKHRLEKHHSELKHQVFFESEIREQKETQEQLISNISEGKSKITDAKHQIKNIRTQWGLEEEKLNSRFSLEADEEKRKGVKLEKSITTIETKIEQSEDSFYGWLNKNVSNWEGNIGKVIDEEILFNPNLIPVQSEKERETFFGVKINLENLDSKIKTVQEYQQEIEQLKKRWEQVQKNILHIEERKTAEQTKLKTAFTKKLKVLNDSIAKEEYQLDQNEEKQKINAVQLDEWENRSKAEKKNRAEEIEKKLESISYKLSKAIDQLTAVKKNISRRVSLRETERDKKTADFEVGKNEKVLTIQTSINAQKEQPDLRIKELRKKQMDELEDKGADRNQLEKIESQLSIIMASLEFIAQNETTVIEYQKDKREFFDLLPKWKTDKHLLEKQQLQLGETHKLELSKSQKKLNYQIQKVKELEQEMGKFENDISSFETFKISDTFLTLQNTSVENSEEEEQNISKLADRKSVV